MTIYETIKAAVPVRQAAEHYGLRVNRTVWLAVRFTMTGIPA